MWFNVIKSYYTLGLYTKQQMQVFVAAGWITAEQAQSISMTET